MLYRVDSISFYKNTFGTQTRKSCNLSMSFCNLTNHVKTRLSLIKCGMHGSLQRKVMTYSEDCFMDVTRIALIGYDLREVECR